MLLLGGKTFTVDGVTVFADRSRQVPELVWVGVVGEDGYAFNGLGLASKLEHVASNPTQSTGISRSATLDFKASGVPRSGVPRERPFAYCQVALYSYSRRAGST